MRFSLLLCSLIFLSGCGGGGSSSNTTTNETETLSYIPTQLSNNIAIRFLNKATFGATQQSRETLQKEGVRAWLQKQYALPLHKDIYLKKMISLAKQCEPNAFKATTESYLKENDTIFNKNIASFKTPRYRMTSWFDNALMEKDQLRHKVAYALSQIIVESDFEPIFTRRAEALARYFDILYMDAFSSYKKLLQDISLNSGMGMFLTYNGNKKLHFNDANISIFPDENYAREVMQLFSIGLNKLNIDGTPQKDAKGNLIPTYTQTDVNQLAKVLTGWDLQNNRKYGKVGFKEGDLTHPLEFTALYHDFGAKKLLGETIGANLSGKADMFKAIDIIMHQKSVAPYISKNLIMRLTKSNPSPAYIARVATVFQKTEGNLKEVVNAIFLDKELWHDLTTKTIMKFKEPLIAYTQFLRAMKAKPFPSWYYCGYGGPKDATASNCVVVKNSFLFNNPRDYLAQGAGLAPNVFNFYDNDFIPNDTAFQAKNFHAPELQIQSDTMLIKYNNNINNVLEHWEKGNILEKHHRDANGVWKKYKTIQEFIADAPRLHNVPVYYLGADKMLLDAQDEYNVLEMAIDGDTDGDFKNLHDYRDSNATQDEKALKALIVFENEKLTGGLLSQDEMDIMYNALKEKLYNKYANYNPEEKDNKWAPRTKKYQLYRNIIIPVIRAIVSSDKYMVE